ncbi:cupin domain-containing protein [Donghicola sp. XS_ASV15]|uniref:cupin domain-containing protein n=1 Tax=Donghicola sp. XS_ASV15 TaxID=3241295 RepID=UPI003513CB1F
MNSFEDPENEVGLRLRSLRLARGMSQRALAKAAGVNNSTISLIESGQMNPSVGALKRVLTGFPIGIAEFFAFEASPEEQVFFAAEELKEIGKGGVSYRQVGSNTPGRSLQILHETYRPGASTGTVLLSHEGEEGGIVIQGRLEVTVGEQRKILGPGDAYLFDSRRPHAFRAVGAVECVVISCSTPPTF